jgi:Zn-dependent protease with chaperone function
MIYVLFLMLALVYNWRKFGKDRHALIQSLKESTHVSHREMILAHNFHVFILEVFMAIVVAHLITERSMAVGILGLGFLYLIILFCGFFIYRSFIRYLERSATLDLWDSFKSHIIKELRVSFALIMLPILIYSVISWTFQDGVYEEWGSLWFIGIFFNIIFVSVLTILCTVIIMLRLIPNREITEPEYLEIINRRLEQINMPNFRVRWIETDVKNAFVVGLKILRFSNQTMFVGRKLRNMLTMEEFDAVICHELAHVANRHVHKRVIDLMKNFISIIIGVVLIMTLVISVSLLYWGEDVSVHTATTSIISFALSFGWFVFNYSLLFETIRSHEYEADAYAVMKMGASYKALVTSLEKLSSPEELPEYLVTRTRKAQKKGLVARYISRYFSTHPDLEERSKFLREKMELELPFNYYISSAQKVRAYLSYLINWKVSVPLFVSFVCLFGWMTMNYKRGAKMIAYIQRTPAQILVKDEILMGNLNSHPLLIGQTMMFYIVNKNDETLIEASLKKGASKSRTLIYLAQQKNFTLLERYYQAYQKEISEDEYFLILRKTAQVNFTEGYRYLVNAERFEGLSSSYKEDISKFHEKSERAPASVKE